MVKIISSIMVFLVVGQAKGQETGVKHPILFVRAAVALERSPVQDYLGFGLQIPVSEKIHTGVNFGPFSKDYKASSGPNLHFEFGATLGYTFFRNDFSRVYVKTDLSYFRVDKFKGMDNRYFRQGFGLGYQLIAYRSIVLDAGLNLGGFYYGRKRDRYDDPYTIYQPAEFKLGIGYQF